MFACLYFAGNISYVLRSTWPPPDESPLPAADAWVVGILGALGAAMGVWWPGSIAPHGASFAMTLLGAAAGTALDAASGPRPGWPPVLGAIAGLRLRAHYRELPPRRPRAGVARRAARLVVGAAAFWSAAGLGLYQHGEISVESPDGPQKMRLKDCVRHVVRSPIWAEGWEVLRRVLREEGGGWDAWRTHDWERTWRKAARAMDLTGEAHARRVLGVEASDGWAAIKQAHRAKALEYHPDKQGAASEAEQEQAAAKFRECQEAFDTLKALHKSSRAEE